MFYRYAFKKARSSQAIDLLYKQKGVIKKAARDLMDIEPSSPVAVRARPLKDVPK